MPASCRVRLPEPAILTWARTEMGLELEDVARFFGHKDPDEVAAWESGDVRPTFRQLETLAERLHRPISAFFLPSVPPQAPLPKDHRTLPQTVPGDYRPATLLAFRQVRNMLADTEGLLEVLGLDLAYSLPRWSADDDLEGVATSLRRILGVTMEAQVHELGDYRVALDRWRDALFDVGVVIRICRMAITDVRAFCLASQRLVGIGLSNEDHEHGRIFSLFHEVAHLGIGDLGVSGLLGRGARQDSPNWALERYCERFAGAFLMPAAEPLVLEVLSRLEWDLSYEAALAASKALKVSKYAAVFRARDLDKVEESACWDAVDQWKAIDARIAAGQPPSEGGNYNLTQISYVGKRLRSLVVQALNSDLLTTAEAAVVIGVHPDVIEAMRY